MNQFKDGETSEPKLRPFSQPLVVNSTGISKIALFAALAIAVLYGLYNWTLCQQVHVSSKIKTNKSDSFITESLQRFDEKPIVFPDRFGPSPAFLEWHARSPCFIV